MLVLLHRHCEWRDDIRKTHTVSEGEDIVNARLAFGQHENVSCTTSQCHQIKIWFKAEDEYEGHCSMTTTTTWQKPWAAM